MIQVQPNARYVILGEDQAHASLTELVQYHQAVGIQPFMEKLTVPCGQVSVEDLQPEEGIGHGLCPEQIKSLWQLPSFVFPLGVSHSGQAAWPLLCVLGSTTSWALGSPGVGERPWWADDTLLPPECQQWAQLGIPLCCAVWDVWRVCKPLLNPLFPPSEK